MLDATTFQALIPARNRDEQAIKELVRVYGPHLERAAQAQMLGMRGKLALGAEDVAQTVLVRFFVRLRRGEFELPGPDELVKLLNVLTRNYVIDEYRKEQTCRRRSSRVTDHDSETDILSAVLAPTGTPSRIVSDAELDRELRRRLSPEELLLAEQAPPAAAGRTRSCGGHPSGRSGRKRLHRAMSRVCRELGLEVPS